MATALAEQRTASPATTTSALAGRLQDLSWADLTPEAVTVAKQCLLDWVGVTLAARDEPLVGIMLEELANGGECSLLGTDRRASLQDAVLINGAASHALDFDDVITAMGHPTVPVAPVALSLSEVTGATGRDMLLAFIAGVETECRIGRLMGPSHYAKGWHGTATYGTFGAMACAAKLLDLSDQQLLHAFGIAGTQAAGLKSVFGTMSKPLHAGKAAQSGLLAARLARRGFTSDTNILESDQGFAATQSTTVNPAAALAEIPVGLYVVNALFKYHAACYLTHNAIEASGRLRQDHTLRPEDIAAVRVHVHAAHMGVCNIQDPQTGLECKFSLRMTTALALAGEDTFQENLYTDATAQRPDLVALRKTIEVTPDAQGAGTLVEVLLKDGRTVSETADVAIPVRDLAAQQEKLERKFLHLATPMVGRGRAELIIGACSNLETAPSVRGLLDLCKA